MAGVAVVMIQHGGSLRAEALAAALAHHHPQWRVGAVWVGDPVLRPVLPTVPWWYGGRLSADQERSLVMFTAAQAGWLVVLATTQRLLREGYDHVVVLQAGAVAVVGPLDGLLTGDGAMATLVPRVHGDALADGLAPDALDLVRAGAYSTSVAVLHRGGEAVVDRLLAALPGATVAEAFAAVALDPQVARCTDPAIGAGTWSWPATIALLDVPQFDPAQPWVLDPDEQRRARVDAVADPAVVAVLTEAADQLGGPPAGARLPGGVAIDDTIRQLVRNATPPAPAPFSRPAEFRRWLAARYWMGLHERRPDLRTAFPDPQGADAARYANWVRWSFVGGETPFGLAAPGSTAATDAVRGRAGGVNLAGYVGLDMSLGHVARRLHHAVTAAAVPCAVVAVERSASPPAHDALAAGGGPLFDTTLAVVTADQFAALRDDHVELFDATRRMIGYWFWELSELSPSMRPALDLVDEVWVGSQFVADAFAAATSKPVHRVPLPVPRPTVAALGRNELAALAGLHGRFVFVVTFDHLSVTARKNPLDVVTAFRAAFSEGEGPVLVVKSINAHQRWPAHQQLLAAAHGRADIRVVDAHLDRAGQMALLAHSDCLVSLHRSEGLGLHMAEAMWLGTPVIATAYSGNLDLMDEGSAALVGFELVKVGAAGQGVYPPTATWAQPDVGQAAELMRRMAGDAAWREGLTAGALRRMQQQATIADTGRLIAGLLGIAASSRQDVR
ncbi:MAG: glycosyltransferase [Actinomycetota bacterium]|nr:glycosyltransferase [Actinomycetota bacterium]